MNKAEWRADDGAAPIRVARVGLLVRQSASLETKYAGFSRSRSALWVVIAANFLLLLAHPAHACSEDETVTRYQ
jgi:hypothetical protein